MPDRWNHPDLPNFLEGRLREEDQGHQSIPRGFSPAMSYGRHKGPPRPDTRVAAVLLLLYREGDEWFLPLTLRQPHLSAHAGQISLPGGAVDVGETTDAAAIREFVEELGGHPASMRILGQLKPVFVFNSNFLVYPWVAEATAPPSWIPNPDEVAEIIPMPITNIVQSSSFRPMVVRRGKFQFTAPAIAIGQHQVWGATRVILADLARHIVPPNCQHE